jgi:hypothetical protein
MNTQKNLYVETGKICSKLCQSNGRLYW